MALDIQAAIASLRTGEESLRRALAAPPGRSGEPRAAAQSLGQTGSREPVPPLIDALRAEPWLQYPAIHALGEIGDPRAAPALLDLRDDEFFRGPALQALGRLAGREALPRLIPHLY